MKIGLLVHVVSMAMDKQLFSVTRDKVLHVIQNTKPNSDFNDILLVNYKKECSVLGSDILLKPFTEAINNISKVTFPRELKCLRFQSEDHT